MEHQPWIPRDVVTAAKQMDLLTYLQRYDPGELVRLSPVCSLPVPMTA